MKKRLWVGTTVALALGIVGTATLWQQARADTPNSIIVAIPKNVTITVGAHQIHFIGKPTSTSAVNCAEGTPQPQTVVVVDPGGGSASQITGVLAFHDHEIPLGARYSITSENWKVECNADLRLWVATLN